MQLQLNCCPISVNLSLYPCNLLACRSFGEVFSAPFSDIIQTSFFRRIEYYMSSSKAEQICLAKIVIIGDSGVGKTNLMTKYCEGVFKESYVATIGVDFKLKDIKINDLLIRLQIWDTAGQERFRNITQAYFKGAKGIILAFDITHAESFRNLSCWIRQIESVSNQNMVKLLVGTKLDMQDERVVSTEAAQQFAQKYSMLYSEVSSKNGTNLEDTFKKLAQGIKSNYEKEVPNDSISIVLKALQHNGKGNCVC